MSKSIQMARRLALAMLVLLCAALPAQAAIDTLQLGARYDNINSMCFRRAPRASSVHLQDRKRRAAGRALRDDQERHDQCLVEVGRVATLAQQLRHHRHGLLRLPRLGPQLALRQQLDQGQQHRLRQRRRPNGNRFNPNKLLLDPYAREISQDPNTPSLSDGTIYASGATHRNKDSGACAPKGIVLATDTTHRHQAHARLQGRRGLRGARARPDHERHQHPAAQRGTYAGAALKAAYLASLGVTAVEFLPVQETQNDTNDVDPNSHQRRQLLGLHDAELSSRRIGAIPRTRRAGGPTREWKAMVKAFHDAGIKVYIDVVYNHTGEGGAWGGSDGLTVYNILSFRGLDNPTYYSLTSQLPVPLGQHRRRRQLQHAQHDCAEPDRRLAGLLARQPGRRRLPFRSGLGAGQHLSARLLQLRQDGCGNALNRIVNELPPRAGVRRQRHRSDRRAVGHRRQFLSGRRLSERLGRVERQVPRRAAQESRTSLGVETVLTHGTLASRFAGSSDLYGDDGRKPWHSVNFMVAHDGFTLRDLYAYNSKQNTQPWPYGPSDGGEDTTTVGTRAASAPISARRRAPAWLS
jgi:isoamylase